MIRRLLRSLARPAPSRREPVAPRVQPLLAGELTLLRVHALPDSICVVGLGPTATVHAELTVSEAVRLMADLDEALVLALATSPSRRERELLGYRGPTP